MAKHLELGIKGEFIASKFLESKGFTILEKNWRHRKAEVDIIAMDGDVLVFVEVKTRSTEMWGAPELSVSSKKEQLLADALSVYMEQIGHTWEVRFDVVGVLLLEAGYREVRHHRDAFFPGLE